MRLCLAALLCLFSRTCLWVFVARYRKCFTLISLFLFFPLDYFIGMRFSKTYIENKLLFGHTPPKNNSHKPMNQWSHMLSSAIELACCYFIYRNLFDSFWNAIFLFVVGCANRMLSLKISNISWPKSLCLLNESVCDTLKKECQKNLTHCQHRERQGI